MSFDAAESQHPHRLLGEILVERRWASESDIDRALESQAAIGGRLGQLLMRIGALSEDVLLGALAEQNGWSRLGIDLPLPEPSAILDAAGRGPGIDWLIDNGLLAWRSDGGGLHWCHRDPLSNAILEALRHAFPGEVLVPVLARSQDIDRLVDEITKLSSNGRLDGSTDQLRALAEEAPTVELVGHLLAQAAEQRASDIHLEPGERHLQARFRIDGVLHHRLSLPMERYAPIASRIKLISGMDIAERRLPQDGRLSTRVGGEEYDLRASSIPGVHGESLVLRLLPKKRGELKLENLGMEADHLALMTTWSNESNGIVLVTGPTGSGKSTTLYGALAEINDGLKKIITVEDPVEFRLPGVTQIQAHADIGLSFASALRSILRQDPDVIMIGEIRDLETAEIAVQASLTGHLVLSTLHTNDALGAFTRLVDMGLEPYLVATPIRGVQAQRLVRRLCPECSRPAEAPGSIRAEVDAFAHGLTGLESPNWRSPTGCPACQGTGYRGRIGIYELVDVDDALKHMVVDQAAASTVRDHVRRAGVRSIRQDGLLKAWRGMTSVEEVLRVVGT